MPSGPVTVSMVGMILIAAGTGAYALWRSDATAPIIGVVRTTEIRVAPEVGGQLVAIKVHKGETVRAGDVVAELSALELSASVEQAQAVLASAVGGPRSCLCRAARRRGRLSGRRDCQGEVAARVRAATTHSRLPTRTQRRRFPAKP